MTLLIIAILLGLWAIVAFIVVALCVASADGDRVEETTRSFRRRRAQSDAPALRPR
jgi:hypothetical protein